MGGRKGEKERGRKREGVRGSRRDSSKQVVTEYSAVSLLKSTNLFIVVLCKCLLPILVHV